MGVGEVISFLYTVFVLWIQSVIAVFFPPAKKSIDGQIVLITGAGHGIGRQLAFEIVRVAPQAHLVLWDLNKVGLQWHLWFGKRAQNISLQPACVSAPV